MTLLQRSTLPASKCHHIFERAQRCLHVALIDTNVAECIGPYAFEAGWICFNFAVRNMPSLPTHLRDSLVMAISLQLV